MKETTNNRAVAIHAVLALFFFIGASAASAQVTQGQEVRTSFKAQSDQLRAVAAPKGGSLIAPGAANARAAAQQALEAYGARFGVDNPSDNLRLMRQATSADGRASLRYQQLHGGVPVIGGELIVNTSAQNGVISVNGEAARLSDVPTTPVVTADEATATAVAAVAKWHDTDSWQLTASVPELTVYVPELIAPSTAPAGLVWKLEISGVAPSRVRELVLIDAVNGGIRLHFNQIHEALNLETYTANNTGSIPGTLLCDETQPDCTSGTNVDADLAHTYATNTYDFYADEHGRDGIDDAGGLIVSVVEWDNGFSCPNAFWAGLMIYCPGAPQADDVVGHELTHGVTENTSNLFYYYQSGAINESLSDVWGEFVDLTNSGGTDTPSTRWQMGEDFAGLGAIRDMSDPTAFNHPDRMTSPWYYTGAGDNGGVHFNSGVNNKAVYLMVDGDTFNGQSIAGLGIPKVADIYYEVQTNYLTSGSDYADLYEALLLGCDNLIGHEGITADDCEEVSKAADAVEMNQQPIADFNPDAEYCPTGMTFQETAYSEDFEGSASIAVVKDEGDNTWVLDSIFASEGQVRMFIPDIGTEASDTSAITPEFTVPASGYFHFHHAYETEASGGNYYDGGTVEYSLDGGTVWLNMDTFDTEGKDYDGLLLADNPLVGEPGFSGTSHGYVSTRYDISSLAGQDVMVRFRFGTDSSGAPVARAGSVGWSIDDVRVYNCQNGPTADAGDDQSVAANESVDLDATGSSDAEGEVSYAWTQLSGDSVQLVNAGSAEPTFTAPPSDGSLTFRVTVTDSDGATDSDTVIVGVTNTAPTADAGSDGKARGEASVTLDGTGSSDAESSLTYSWIQTEGTPVVFTDSTSALGTFVAPSTTETLTFQLTVTDTGGETDTDTVSVDVWTIPFSGGSSISPWLLALLALLGATKLQQFQQRARVIPH